MQIVINIDDGIAQGIIEGQGDAPRNIVRSFQATIADAIKNGVQLQEGVRLKDVNKIEALLGLDKADNTIAKALKNIIESVPTVIEVDECTCKESKVMTFEDKAEIVISQLREDRDKLQNIINQIKTEIEDTGAYEQEVHGKTEFLRGINYCLSILDKYKEEKEESEEYECR